MSENESEEIEISSRVKFIRPLSCFVLWILNRVQSNKNYFDVAIKEGEESRNMVRKYFHAAFYDRSRWYLPILFAILVLLSVDACVVVPILPALFNCEILPFSLPLQSYGLMLDATGAVIIALGLFRGIKGLQTDTPSQYAGGATYGGTVLEMKPGPISSTVRSTVDGFYGTLFLVLGFLIQIVTISNIL